MKLIDFINESDYSNFPLDFFKIEESDTEPMFKWAFYNSDIQGYESIKGFYKPISLI